MDVLRIKRPAIIIYNTYMLRTPYMKESFKHLQNSLNVLVVRQLSAQKVGLMLSSNSSQGCQVCFHTTTFFFPSYRLNSKADQTHQPWLATSLGEGPLNSKMAGYEASNCTL